MADNNAQKNHSISNIKLPEDRQKLLQLANSVNQDIVVRDRTTFIIIILIFSFLIFVLFNLALYFNPQPNTSFLAKIIVACIPVLILYLIFRNFSARRIPLFTLKPEGLETSVFKTTIPWEGILDFKERASSFHQSLNIGTAITFNIDTDYLPEKTGKPRFRSSFVRLSKSLGDNALTISGCGVRSTTSDVVLAQIQTYRTAALARKKLQDMA